jgi:hypothetical protein
MGLTEIKTFQWRCDWCRRTEAQVATSASLPEGWWRVEVHNCGSTNYTRTDELCPRCWVKYQNDK